jgi:hypothetical protein
MVAFTIVCDMQVRVMQMAQVRGQTIQREVYNTTISTQLCNYM